MPGDHPETALEDESLCRKGGAVHVNASGNSLIIYPSPSRSSTTSSGSPRTSDPSPRPTVTQSAIRWGSSSSLAPPGVATRVTDVTMLAAATLKASDAKGNTMNRPSSISLLCRAIVVTSPSATPGGERRCGSSRHRWRNSAPPECSVGRGQQCLPAHDPQEWSVLEPNQALMAEGREMQSSLGGPLGDLPLRWRLGITRTSIDHHHAAKPHGSRPEPGTFTWPRTVPKGHGNSSSTGEGAGGDAQQTGEIRE